MRLFISNFPYTTTEDDIRELLSDFGAAENIRIMTDRDTGRSRGFGFADMDDLEGQRAIEGLDGYELGGRRLKVNEAQPRQPRENDHSRDRAFAPRR